MALTAPHPPSRAARAASRPSSFVQVVDPPRARAGPHRDPHVTWQAPLISTSRCGATSCWWAARSPRSCSPGCSCSRSSQVARSRGYDLEDTLIVGAGPVGRRGGAGLGGQLRVRPRPVGFVDRFEEHLPLPDHRSARGPPRHPRGDARSATSSWPSAARPSPSSSATSGTARSCRCSSTPCPGSSSSACRRATWASRSTASPSTRWAGPAATTSMWPLKRAFDLAVAGVPPGARPLRRCAVRRRGEAVEPRAGLLPAGPGQRRRRAVRHLEVPHA